MKYRMLNGKIAEADSLRQLAEIMNEMVMTPADTLEEWMKDSAERAQVYSGSIMRCTTVEEHIEDLIKEGFVTPLE